MKREETELWVRTEEVGVNQSWVTCRGNRSLKDA